MKIRFLIPVIIASFVAFGCGQKESSTAGGESAAAPASGPRTIELTAGDNMKFNLATIDAKPGEEIKVILTNIGSQPKEVMGHNWILLKAGTDVAAYATAAAVDKASDYFPAALKDQVLAHIPLLGPRKSGEVTIKVPETPGDYPFLCSFPAHFQVGMKGVLTVK